MANQINITGKLTPSVKRGVADISKKLFTHFKITQSSLEVFFLSDKEMKVLKKKYLPKKTGPANTLSFAPTKDFPHPETKLKPLGDIYINQDLTKGKLSEIKPLIIHSFLHLLGYHHQDERDMIEMNRLAEEVQTKISKGRRG